MQTDHQRSYEFEPIVIGRGLDDFASEDEFAALIVEIEDTTAPPPLVVMDFDSEVEAPLQAAAPTALPERPQASIKSWVPVRAIASVTHRYRRFATALRGVRRRGRLAMSSAAEMMAVAAGVVGVWLAIRVPIGIAFVSGVIESAQARRRLAWKSLGAHRVGALALLHRRGTVAGLTAAALAGIFAEPSNPPALSPVAEVSTSAVTAAPQTAAEVAGRPEPFPAASMERPAVPAALKAVAQSARPELQNTVYRGTTAGLQSDTPSRPPMLLAVVDRDSPGMTVTEPMPVPVAIVSAALEAPKPAAAEPAAYVPAVLGTASDTLMADRSAIDDVLVAYRRSFNSLDAGAVSAIWRGADTRALARAFSTLTRQHITFDGCDVRVTAADRARARCDGILSYVQKAGDTTPQQRRVSWSIDLGRPDDRWVIVGVQAR